MLNLDHVKSLPITVQCLHIHAHEGGFYLVEMEFEHHREYVAGNNGKPVHFMSIEDVRQQLKGCHPDKVMLIHESAHGEMIGMSHDASEAMSMEIPWNWQKDQLH